MLAYSTCIGDVLAEHPRLVGVVFTLGLAVGQVGTALGANGVSVGGP